MPKMALNKRQIFICLIIGNLSSAVASNPPAMAWDLATWFTDSVNGLHDALAPGKGEAQTPLPVPQNQPPIGRSGNQAIEPCAAPPPQPIAIAPKMRPQPQAIAIAPSPESTMPESTMPDRVAYNQGGAITQNQVDRMSKYKSPQTYKAVRSILGTPNYRESKADIYEIQGTSDGVMAAKRFIVSYEFVADNNYAAPLATGWYQQ